MKKLISFLAVVLSFILTVSISAGPGQTVDTLAAVVTNARTARAGATNVSKTDINKTEFSSAAAVTKEAVTINEKNIGSLSNINSGFAETNIEQIVRVSDSLGYVNDELLIFFAQGVSVSRRLAIIHSIGGIIVGYEPLSGIYQVRIAEKSLDEITVLCETLMESDEVDAASANMVIKYASTAIPSDPWLLPHGWDESSPEGSNWWQEAIQAPSAWDYNDHFSKIKIGIVDSGFYTSHEDLQGLISFPNSTAASQNRASDHGTHVAGIIAANANNDKGITGVCWNAELICQDWEPDLFQLWFTETKILSGFINVVKSGAKVVNFSIGASSAYSNINIFWDITMKFEGIIYSYVMSRLLSQGYDFVVVQSAGNGDIDGNPCDISKNGLFCAINEGSTRTVSGVSYSDIADRIIIVGSVYHTVGYDYKQSFFSNYGDIDICAPGEDIFSCTYSESMDYAYMSGTSMAAPIVTGVSALVWSVNPSFTGAQVKAIVCNPANTCYGADATISQPFSYRIVNAKLAVEAAIALTE